MQKVEALFRLQTLDLEIEAKTRQLHDVEGQLGESEELVAAREAATSAAEGVRAAEVDLREKEWAVSRTEAKLKEVNAALYSGKSRPTKELTNLQKEAQLLSQQKSRGEDAVLEAMDLLERKQAALAEARARLAAVEAAWREQQERLRGQQQTLQEELAALAEARAEVARAADPSHLPVYENLRRLKGGRAVARVEQSICSGCRVTMALQLVQRARSNPGLTFCSTCGRILYVPR